MNKNIILRALIRGTALMLMVLALQAYAQTLLKPAINRKISNWKGLIKAFEIQTSKLDAICQSPRISKIVSKKIKKSNNVYALKLIIEKADKKGELKSQELKEAEAIATKLRKTISRIRVLEKSTKQVTFVVSPISGIKVLPYNPVVPGKITNKIKVIAAQGEFEPASFVLYSKSGIKDVALKVGDFRSKKGDIISASNIDLKVVKCWYQTGFNWNAGNFYEGLRVLVPELLLKDDSLVKVDTVKKENHLKLQFPKKEEYVWISNPDQEFKTRDQETWLTVDQFPVKDSKKLLPVSIPVKSCKQFWVTVKVPEDAKAGIYSTSIKALSQGKEFETITIKLRVLPFKLANPKTYYDLDKKFTSSIYYCGQLAEEGEKGTVYAIKKNKEQLRAELKDMYDHGVTNPIFMTHHWSGNWNDMDRHLKAMGEYLKMRKEIGMENQTVYCQLRELNFESFLGVNFSKGLGIPVSAEKLRDLQKRVKEIIKFFKSHDVSEVYFYGRDEAKDETVAAQRPVWKAVHEAGGKIMVAGYRAGIEGNKKGSFELAGDIQDLFISAGKFYREESAKWHSKGHKIWAYANPQGGPENPLLYRKGFGFGLWRANYDGAATWAYTHYFPPWNDFTTNSEWTKKYTLAYPTADGIVDTIAWEGYREAIDDIRYGTTLKEMIAKAKKEKRKMGIAQKAEKFLETFDVNDNPELIRLKIINYILKLR